MCSLPLSNCALSVNVFDESLASGGGERTLRDRVETRSLASVQSWLALHFAPPTGFRRGCRFVTSSPEMFLDTEARVAIFEVSNQTESERVVVRSGSRRRGK